MASLTIIVGGERLEDIIPKRMHERIIKSFIGMINLARAIHSRFPLLVGTGTVYSLERNNLIEGS